MESTDFNNKQKELLLDLKKDNLLSEEEFQEKMKLIIDKETKETAEYERKQHEQKINQEIQPYLKKLEDSLKAGLITQEEFEAKKSLLIPAMEKRHKKSIENQKKTDLRMKIGASIGVSIFVLIMIMTTVKDAKNAKSNNKSIKTEPNKTQILNPKPDKHVFYYNAMQTMALEGVEPKDMKTESITGRIEFTENAVTVFSGDSGNKYEIFTIDKHLNAPDGDMKGSHLLMVHNNKDEKFNISISNNSGANVVTVHSIQTSMMMLFYINDGFTLDLKIYE